MLTHLDIRDFTIIRHVALDLGPGMTVLTGETGAGKSILVDALSLALGERAGSGTVRPGAERAEVVAIFDTTGSPAVRQWLAAQELEQEDQECILRRSLAADGRSRAYINGRPVPIQSLGAIGDLLVDIHGQHAHQSLLRRDAQRSLLDEHAGHASVLAGLGDLYRRWQAIGREVQAAGGDRSDRDAELDLLRYQVQELEQLNAEPRAIQELDEEYARLANAGRLLEGCQRSLGILETDEPAAALSGLEAATREIAELEHFDTSLGAVRTLLDEALIQAREAASELRHYLDTLDLDPQRLQWLESRIGALHDAARKHQVKPMGLARRLAELQSRLSRLEGGEARLRELEAELAQVLEDYGNLARELYAGRAAAAKDLSERVSANMHDLGMPGGRFEVSVQHLPTEQPSAAGLDRVEFLVSANPGQPLAPLGKVASGGELSRISLGLQVIGAAGSGVPTLVFDEVDVGVGGRVAEIVGQRLRHLAGSRQVLCVTHLPQVASQGHHHLQAHKLTAKDETSATVHPLSGETRVEEIARMLGGIEITAQTTAHAREMIERAQA